MIRIAVVGDIGSGKSFISNLFNQPVFNADLEVADIYKKDRYCFAKIKKAIPNFRKLVGRLVNINPPVVEPIKQPSTNGIIAPLLISL